MSDQIWKRCTVCKKSKKVPQDYHRRKRKLVDGSVTEYPSGFCKECSRVKVNEYRNRNREAVRERDRIWLEKNREHRRKYNRDWWRITYGQGKNYQVDVKKERERTPIYPVEPFREWMLQTERDRAIVGDVSKHKNYEFKDVTTWSTIAMQAGIDPTTLTKIRRGGKKMVSMLTVDAVGTALGRPDLLALLYPQDD